MGLLLVLSFISRHKLRQVYSLHGIGEGSGLQQRRSDRRASNDEVGLLGLLLSDHAVGNHSAQWLAFRPQLVFMLIY